MRDTKIITLYKKKSAKLDCNNNRIIFLFGIADKVYARVIIPHLLKLAKIVYPKL